jgi:hypothetical protein
VKFQELSSSAPPLGKIITIIPNGGVLHPVVPAPPPAGFTKRGQNS